MVPEPDKNGIRWYGGNTATGRPSIQEDPTRCIEHVKTRDRMAIFHQCKHKRGYGKDGLYCKQHDPDAIAAIEKAKEERFQKRYNIHMKPVEELYKLKDQLITYGHHTNNCSWHRGPDCDCGWVELRRSLLKDKNNS